MAASSRCTKKEARMNRQPHGSHPSTDTLKAPLLRHTDWSSG